MNFLSAEWRDLVMCNWAVAPEVLWPYVPRGTQLDFVDGKTFISLVAFRFVRTRLLGIPIPLHTDFEEINLRFYVTSQRTKEVRRGVVFIKEIVPRYAIANIARAVYNEPYVTMGTRSAITETPTGRRVAYDWWPVGRSRAFRPRVQQLQADTQPLPVLMSAGSHEEFIAEHYYGYTRQSDGSTLEYEVTHPRWNVYPVQHVMIACDFETLYGRHFAAIMHNTPDSVLVADGSPIGVKFGSRFR